MELAEGKASRDVQVDFRLGERSAGVDGALVAAEATRQRRLVVSRIGGVFDIQLGFLPAVVGCDQVSLPLRRWRKKNTMISSLRFYWVLD